MRILVLFLAVALFGCGQSVWVEEAKQLAIDTAVETCETTLEDSVSYESMNETTKLQAMSLCSKGLVLAPHETF